MKAKVAHLFKKLEEIERDTLELKKLTDRIADDREYSPILRESFLSEMEKLNEQRSDILRVSVSAPSSQELEVPTKVHEVVNSGLEKKKSEKPIRKY
ncbi:MAG: hypothetical protein O9264_08280 [Leptospira sp.]|nr:hypothetical protein [Leptospira sp.]